MVSGSIKIPSEEPTDGAPRTVQCRPCDWPRTPFYSPWGLLPNQRRSRVLCAGRFIRVLAHPAPAAETEARGRQLMGLALLAQAPPERHLRTRASQRPKRVAMNFESWRSKSTISGRGLEL